MHLLTARELLEELEMSEAIERMAQVLMATFAWPFETCLAEAALIPDGSRSDVAVACAQLRAAKLSHDQTVLEAAHRRVQAVMTEAFAKVEMTPIIRGSIVSMIHPEGRA